MNTTMIVDTLWVVFAALLVFFMNLGSQRSNQVCKIKKYGKHPVKELYCFCSSSLGFMLLGWGLMFGGDNPIIGTKELFILGGSDLASTKTL